MNIEISPRVDENLEVIRNYISGHSEGYADRTVARILQAIGMLENFPLLGRSGLVEDTRELIIVGLPYIAVYEISGKATMRIVRILHTRRQFP